MGHTPREHYFHDDEQPACCCGLPEYFTVRMRFGAELVEHISPFVPTPSKLPIGLAYKITTGEAEPLTLNLPIGLAYKITTGEAEPLTLNLPIGLAYKITTGVAEPLALDLPIGLAYSIHAGEAEPLGLNLPIGLAYSIHAGEAEPLGLKLPIGIAYSLEAGGDPPPGGGGAGCDEAEPHLESFIPIVKTVNAGESKWLYFDVSLGSVYHVTLNSIVGPDAWLIGYHGTSCADKLSFFSLGPTPACESFTAPTSERIYVELVGPLAGSSTISLTFDFGPCP